METFTPVTLADAIDSETRTALYGGDHTPTPVDQQISRNNAEHREANCGLSGADIEQDKLILSKNLILAAAVSSTLRFLPDQVSNARPREGERAETFARRKLRLDWQLRMARLIDNAADDKALDALFSLAQKDYAYSLRDDLVLYQDTNNHARCALGTLIQSMFRQAVNTIMYHERRKQNAEAARLATAKAMADFDTGQSESGGSSADGLANLVMTPTPSDPMTEGDTTAQPGRAALTEALEPGDLLNDIPQGDLELALDSLHKQLTAVKLTVEQRIVGWTSYAPRPMAYYSVRNPDDVAGGYLEADSLAQARELQALVDRRAEDDAARSQAAVAMSMDELANMH